VNLLGAPTLSDRIGVTTGIRHEERTTDTDVYQALLIIARSNHGLRQDIVA
jgi:hypothetical protein